MIRKFGKVNGPPEAVRAMFLDVDRWPEWLPSIASTRVLESDDVRCLAEIDQVIQGRTRHQTIEFRFTPRGYVERQIAGWLRTYEAEWGFAADRDGGGTLVSARIRLDIGFSGIFVSRRTVQRTIDRTFEETLRGARKQIRATEAPAPGQDVETLDRRETRIRVFETFAGLEIWIDDRRYVLPLVD